MMVNQLSREGSYCQLLARDNNCVSYNLGDCVMLFVVIS